MTGVSRMWWMFAIRGVAAILFGLAALIWPITAILVLVNLFGAYMLVDGIFAVAAALTGRSGHKAWWATLIEGLVGIGLGIFSFIAPGVVVTSLIWVMAAWAIVTGIFEIIAAIRLRETITNEWMLGLGGVLSIIFGILLAIQPGVGALTILWLIGGYAIVFGIMFIVLAFRLRGMGSSAQTPTPSAGMRSA
ncbi:MAG: HdeD family acid-resistance protein [Chloroflexota bacterium]